jgi:ferredoxin
LYTKAIDTAERWSGRFVDLLASVDELRDAYATGLLHNLSKTAGGDRREVLENFIGTFRQSWKQAGKSLDGAQDNKRLREIIKRRQQNMGLARGGLGGGAPDGGQGLLNRQAGAPQPNAHSLQPGGPLGGAFSSMPGDAGGAGDAGATRSTGVAGGAKSAGVTRSTGATGIARAETHKLSHRRNVLLAALHGTPQTAPHVTLLGTTTVYAQCTGCGTCVNACPLSARRLVRGNSAILFSDLTPQTGPAAKQVAYVDNLVCTGCSACLQHCPTGACVYATVTGSELLQGLRE